MKTSDLKVLKDLLKKSIFCNGYLTIVKCCENDNDTFSKVKIMYNDKVLTVGEFGYAYLISWWCDGSITSAFATDITNICRTYNGRY